MRCGSGSAAIADTPWPLPSAAYSIAVTWPGKLDHCASRTSGIGPPELRRSSSTGASASLSLPSTRCPFRRSGIQAVRPEPPSPPSLGRKAADLRGFGTDGDRHRRRSEPADWHCCLLRISGLRRPLLPNSARYTLAYLFAGLYAASFGSDCQLSRAVRIEGRADRRIGMSTER